MSDVIKERPFDNFRTAITDPPYFFGRSGLLKEICRTPFQVRMLLGGRRLGKTSALRAIEWTLLDHNFKGNRRAFPVLINLHVEQPDCLPNLLYMLIFRLKEAIGKWRQIPTGELRDMYRHYLRQITGGEVSVGILKLKINNPDNERKLSNDDFRYDLVRIIDELRRNDFEGVCFLFDEAEYIVRQPWGNNAWSYFRGLKDNDTTLKSVLGIVLSGYRDVKEYSQHVGSPLLNIAKVEWLSSFEKSDVEKLAIYRSRMEGVDLSTTNINLIFDWGGGHPFLTQQMLNELLDSKGNNPINTLIQTLLRQHDRDFSAWWNVDDVTDGFGPNERIVYKELLSRRRANADNLHHSVNLSVMKVDNALEVLTGTGVVRWVGDGECEIGARLFQEWVARQHPILQS